MTGSISLLLGGLGIGSLLTSVVSHIIARRSANGDRRYTEKREAYLGLLDALHQAAVHPSDENSKRFALWQTRCELFGSLEVANFVQRMIDTNEAPREQRYIAHRGLIDAMRADLSR